MWVKRANIGYILRKGAQRMKKLIIIAHPDIESSQVNSSWLSAIATEEQVTIHNIYKLYPTYEIDIQVEQQLIEQHDQVILQFPFYWFGCPPLMKKWLDEVFSSGWAFDAKINQMENFPVALVVSAGINQDEYSQTGKSGYSLEQLLAPFETIFNYLKSDYRGFYAFYGSHKADANDINKSKTDYLNFINNL